MQLVQLMKLPAAPMIEAAAALEWHDVAVDDDGEVMVLLVVIRSGPRARIVDGRDAVAIVFCIVG